MTELPEMTTLDIVEHDTGRVLRESIGREDLFQMFIDTQWRFVCFERNPDVGIPYMLVDTVNLTPPGFVYLTGGGEAVEYDPDECGGFV